MTARRNSDERAVAGDIGDRYFFGQPKVSSVRFDYEAEVEGATSPRSTLLRVKVTERR